jgi:hypothetical protein
MKKQRKQLRRKRKRKKERRWMKCYIRMTSEREAKSRPEILKLKSSVIVLLAGTIGKCRMNDGEADT